MMNYQDIETQIEKLIDINKPSHDFLANISNFFNEPIAGGNINFSYSVIAYLRKNEKEHEMQKLDLEEQINYNKTEIIKYTEKLNNLLYTAKFAVSVVTILSIIFAIIGLHSEFK
jgi:hypothetical protein